MEPILSFKTIIRLTYGKFGVVVTSRFIEIEQPTRDWLETYYPNKFKEIYFTNHWSLSQSNYRSKVDICIDCGAKVIIEDSLEYAKPCSQRGIKAYLLSRPWNKSDGRFNQIIRARSWNELMERF